ncbi:MAG: hypothetical protein JSW51_11945 [Gemmatimonadota bacterium]|nr:MAG: hypothetical protein JSW51_11945 [Gemmatimonadota bacterium]
MSMTETLVPLRVPELGPYLGKLVAGTERAARWIPLDEVRYQLATRIIEQGGEARRLAAAADHSSALAVLGRDAWRDAWEGAVDTVVATLANRLSVQIDAEAAAVKMGRRRRTRLKPGASAKRAIAIRLSASGAALLPVLDEIEQRAAEVVAANLSDDAVERWQEIQKLAARRLEAAWFDLETAVDGEVASWMRAMDEVARWRKPLWPVAVVALVAFGVAVWLGLIFGGHIDPPGWMARLWSQVFAN